MNKTFEQLAEQFNLDLNHNGLNYINPTTGMAHHFFTAHDTEIAKLKQEVCDLSFAARTYAHVLETQKLNSGIKEGTPA